MHLTQTDRTQPQMLESVEMERKCWALRVEGLSYEQIAREVGLGSRAAAWKAVKKALDRYHEEIREDAFCYIRQQNDQLDILTQVYFERARNGDIQAALYMNKLWERRSALNGLDAGKKSEQTDKKLPVRFIENQGRATKG